ncbi:MAG: flagellar assembly peptidoglycan hydrolase FlgJ [Azoarcus sp.]|jgi:flagellar protein FlgJ|nr:flagellar assembly peptidoglycan hydrolase FlgJ [Azoarcus sp.]
MASNGVQLNAFDPRSLDELRRLSKNEVNSDQALRSASKQVEALFLQMMLKAMREATPANGPLDSDQTRMAQELYDQQLTTNLAQSKSTGLADALFRQLGGGRSSGEAAEAAKTTGKSGKTVRSDFPFERVVRGNAGDIQLSVRGSANDVSAAAGKRGAAKTATESAPVSAKFVATVDAARTATGNVPQHVRDFVASVWPHAHAASQATGIPAHFMVAQAALETGWGAKQPKNADGTPSHNLFNIKAGRGWDGPSTAHRAVAEYGGDGWTRQKASFRSYSSYAEAFADYAKLLTDSPRYASVLGKEDAAAFAQGLQSAGYATDPMYADKLVRIIGGNTLRSALAMTA